MRGGRLRVGEILRRVALLGGSISVPLLGFELAVNAIEARRGPLFPGGPRTLTFNRPDPVLGWVHQPGVSQRYGWPEHPSGFVTIATNDLGLREDAPTTPEPAEGTLRVLVLGDSHTDGLVDNRESWPNVLERVALEGGARWEVLNAGVTGYQPTQYQLWWSQWGRALQPDLVLVGYYAGNDFLDPGDSTGDAVVGATASRDPAGRPTAAERLRGVWAPIRAQCRLCALTSMIAHRSMLSGPTFEEAASVRGGSSFERDQYLAAMRHCIGCLWQSLEQPWLIRNDPARYAKELADLETLLGRFADEVAAADARFVVVVIPTKLQVESAVAARAAETGHLLGIPEVLPPFESRVESDVASLLERLDIEMVIVREALEAEHVQTGAPMYYDADWHLNVDGARVVGEAVGAALLP